MIVLHSGFIGVVESSACILKFYTLFFMITYFYLEDLRTLFEFHRRVTMGTYCSVSGYPWQFAHKARLIHPNVSVPRQKQLSQKMIGCCCFSKGLYVIY